MSRLVHYVNQFFAGLGGEDAAGTPPESRPGPVGPGRKLQELLGDDHQVVATVFCGDDYAAGEPGAVETIVGLVREHEPDLVLHGHAHAGAFEGSIAATPVHNVSVPVMKRDFWVFELSVAEPRASAIH